VKQTMNGIALILFACIAGMGLGLAVGSELRAAPTPEPTKEIRAQKFIVVDEEGREKIVLKSTKNGGYMAFYAGDEKELTQFSLSYSTKGGPTISLWDRSMQRWVQIYVADQENKFGVRLTDRKDKSFRGLEAGWK
jgi:hypothetical protein